MVSYIATKPNIKAKTVTAHSTKNRKGIDFAYARVKNVGTGDIFSSRDFLGS